MSKIHPNRDFLGVDLTQYFCKNFDQKSDGTQYRQQNAALIPSAIAQGANSILAHSNRIYGNAFIPSPITDDGDFDPLVAFRHMDTDTNNNVRIYRMLVLPRTDAPETGTGKSSSVSSYGTNITGERTIDASDSEVDTTSYPEDLVYIEFSSLRTSVTSALEAQGLSTSQGATIVAVCIQSDQRDVLDTSSDDCSVSLGIGAICTSNYHTQIRTAVSSLKEDYMQPLAFWSAVDPLGSNTPSTSNQEGLVTTSTSFNNMLDGSSTSRTASTPGINAHVYMHGRGIENTDEGKKVAVKFSVLARTDGVEATIRAEGTSSFTNNYEDISLSSSTASWYDSSDPIYLDSSVEDDDVTTARNKIDILGKLSASGNLYIYAYAFYLIYE